MPQEITLIPSDPYLLEGSGQILSLPIRVRYRDPDTGIIYIPFALVQYYDYSVIPPESLGYKVVLLRDEEGDLPFSEEEISITQEDDILYLYIRDNSEFDGNSETNNIRGAFICAYGEAILPNPTEIPASGKGGCFLKPLPLSGAILLLPLLLTRH